MNDASSIGILLRDKRRERSLTQEALAAEIGVSRSHIAMIETGGDLPGRETLVALFNYFDIPLELLAAKSGEPVGITNGAYASNEKELALLNGFRELSEEEAVALLTYILTRAKSKAN